MTPNAPVVEDDHPDRDWTEPGVFRCSPGVYRIPLPLPQDGLRAVNLYALDHGDGTVSLVDGGWALAGARDQLVAALGALGTALPDVHRFLVTHVHRDHYTQAVVLGAEFGVPVALGSGEKENLDAVRRPGHTPAQSQTTRLDRAGAADLAALIRAHEDPAAPDLVPELWREPDEWIDDGALLTAGERRLTAVETPGHTRGHLVFADDDAGLLFAGDHVLPRITPSIGFEPVPPASPLADFLTSLRLVRSRPDAALLPAHGPIGMRVHERVDALLEHHADRLDATAAALEAGRSTAHEVAAVLPWTRRRRVLADMDPFNGMLAVLETQAHLDVLAERGAVAVVHRDGVAHYTTS